MGLKCSRDPRDFFWLRCYHHAMPRGVAVVIPALNEEETISAAIASARRAGAKEIVVADGGSEDATVSSARNAGAHVIETERVRGRQLNAGAGATSSDIVLFLHADTTLPEEAVESVENAVAEGAVFGGFKLRFRERSPRLRVAETMINLRCSITRSPWGDQAQWMTREQFDRSGGYAEIPIMEDYEMAARMKKRGKVRILPCRVITSGRRFLEKGVLRTAFVNWKIVILWSLGKPPEQLARMYRSNS